MDIIFAITKNSTNTSMPDIIKAIVDRYDPVKTSVIVFGNNPKEAFNFGRDFPTRKALDDALNNLPEEEGEGPNVVKAYNDVKKLFEEAPLQKDARKVLVTMINRPSNNPVDKIKEAVEEVQNKGIIQVPVVMGDDIPEEEEEGLSVFKDNLIKPSADTPAWETAEDIIDKISGLPELYVLFAATTDEAIKQTTYDKMKETIKKMGEKYGIRKHQYSLITFGNPPKKVFDFQNTLPNQKTLVEEVDKLPKSKENIDFNATMVEVAKIFDKIQLTPKSKKVLVVLTDKKFGLKEKPISEALRPLDDKRIIQLAAGIGNDVSEEELEDIARTPRKVSKPKEDETGFQSADAIMKGILGDDVPEADLLFAISVTSPNATKVLDYIKKVLKALANRYPSDKVNIGAVVFGPNTTEIPNNNIPLNSPPNLLNEEELEEAINNLKPVGNDPALNFTKVADVISRIMNSSEPRKGVTKVTVPVFDAPTNQPEEEISEALDKLQKQKILVVSHPLLPKQSSPGSNPGEEEETNPNSKKNCLTSNPDHCANPRKPASDAPGGEGEEEEAQPIPRDPVKQAESIVDVFSKGMKAKGRSCLSTGTIK